MSERNDLDALALQKNSGHPDFRFLYGGEGREYYRWKVSHAPACLSS